MHQKLQQAYANDAEVVFIYAQTVFEGYQRNSYEAGLDDLKKLGITAPYAYDPGHPPTQKRSSIMAGYLTGGTPWTIVIDAEGVVRHSAFTPKDPATLQRVIDTGKRQPK